MLIFDQSIKILINQKLTMKKNDTVPHQRLLMKLLSGGDSQWTKIKQV